MTLLRGLADDLRLDVWLMGYMMPVEQEFVRPDFCWLGTQLACAEMIRSGTTCFADMYYYEDEVAATAAQVGMRAVCAETILKIPAPGAPTYEDSLAYSRDFIARWKDHPLIRPAVAPHALYTSTHEMLVAAVDLAREFDVPLLTHLAETAYEVEEAERVWGELEKLHAYRDRMGWSLPWYSSAETDFNDDMGVTVDGEEGHGVSVFLRDGDDVYRTYFTGDRGVEHLGSHWTWLDLTPFGRQESWEDSPAGWPQTEPYGWIRRHDDYS